MTTIEMLFIIAVGALFYMLSGMIVYMQWLAHLLIFERK